MIRDPKPYPSIEWRNLKVNPASSETKEEISHTTINHGKQSKSFAFNAQDINRWVRSFDFATKTNFFAFKLEGIKFLRNIKINWEIRLATVKF